MFCKLEITDLGYARGVTIGNTFVPFQDPDATNEKLKEVFNQQHVLPPDYWALKKLVDDRVAENNRVNDKVLGEILDVICKHGLLMGAPMA